jgi:putative phosphoribosyl transferase
MRSPAAHQSLPFADRRAAGRRLAGPLRAMHLDHPLVLALPRGGVPVADAVARALAAPLDVLLVRKIGAPGHAEYALGAVAEGPEPQTVLNTEAVALLNPGKDYIEAERTRQLEEIERRRRAYAGGRAPLDPRGRTVILVDDGIATGATARVALVALRRAGAARVVLAVPVAPASSLAAFDSLADDVVCLAMPEPFIAVGDHYRNFNQTSDAEVVATLAAARARMEAGRSEASGTSA